VELRESPLAPPPVHIPPLERGVASVQRHPKRRMVVFPVEGQRMSPACPAFQRDDVFFFDPEKGWASAYTPAGITLPDMNASGCYPAPPITVHEASILPSAPRSGTTKAAESPCVSLGWSGRGPSATRSPVLLRSVQDRGSASSSSSSSYRHISYHSHHGRSGSVTPTGVSSWSSASATRRSSASCGDRPLGTGSTSPAFPTRSHERARESEMS